MSKVQLLLDVVEDMRSLADSIQAVADAMTQSEAQPDTAPKTAETLTSKTKAEKKVTIEEVRAGSYSSFSGRIRRTDPCDFQKVRCGKAVGCC